MILYFSGTGNSEYVAKKIAEQTDDALVSMNALIKQKDTSPLYSETKPFVFVCPTYAWQIPHIVFQFIEKTSFSGNMKAYFILTCGDGTANAISHIKQLCDKKSFVFSGFAEVIMPENYIVMFSAPSETECHKIIAQADLKIDSLGQSLQKGEDFPEFSSSGNLKSGVVNTLFYKLFLNPKGFYATEKCISCGKCAKLCPLNTITMENGLPTWGKHCTQCMACICSCPTNAIEYKKKTQKKNRYYLYSNGEIKS